MDRATGKKLMLKLTSLLSIQTPLPQDTAGHKGVCWPLSLPRPRNLDNNWCPGWTTAKQGHAAHLPHQALPLPLGHSPGKGLHSDPLSLQLVNSGLKFNKNHFIPPCQEPQKSPTSSANTCQAAEGKHPPRCPHSGSAWQLEAMQCYQEGPRSGLNLGTIYPQESRAAGDSDNVFFICHINLIH